MKTVSPSVKPTLFFRDANGRYTPAPEDVILGVALDVYYRDLACGEGLESPEDAMAFVSYRLLRRECEYFALLFLDNRHRVIDFEEMFRGTIDGASVHPREVVKAALGHNAAAVIMMPSTPSMREISGHLERRLAMSITKRSHVPVVSPRLGCATSTPPPTVSKQVPIMM